MSLITTQKSSDALKPSLDRILSLDYRNHPRYRGVVGHWLMNESGGLTVYDISENGNKGTLENAPVWINGLHGPALDFSSTTNRINLGDPANGTLDHGSSSFSLTAWIKISSASANLGPIFDKGANTVDQTGWLWALSSGKSLIAISDGTNRALPGGLTNINDDAWHLLVAVINRSTNRCIQYIDGKQDDDDDISIVTGGISNSLTLYVAERANSGSENLTSVISDLRIYNRVLSADEVMSLYADPFLEIAYPIQRLFISIPAPPPGGEGQIISVSLSEQQDFADLRRLLQEKFPVDTDLISDDLSMSSSRFVTDRQDVSDLIALTRLARLAETQDVIDGLRKTFELGMGENQAAADAAARTFNRFLAERQDISDSTSFNRVASVSASDTLAISDMAQKLFLLNRRESQDVSDSAARTLLKFLTENQSVSDTVQALKFISIMLSETQDVVDGLRKSFEINRIDDQAFADASRRIFEKYLSADNEVASDTSIFVRLVSLILSDREDIADGLRKLFALQPSDSAVMSDATTKLFVKALTENQSVSDVSALHKVLGVGLSDSFVVDDILTKVFFKNIGEREDVEETLRKIIYATLRDVRQDVSDAATVTVISGEPGPAEMFIEYAVSSVVDTMRRRETVADSLRRIVGEKIGKRG